MILTDKNGRLTPPENPAPNASIEDKIAWLRASCAFSNSVNAAFYRSFRKVVK